MARKGGENCRHEPTDQRVESKAKMSRLRAEDGRVANKEHEKPLRASSGIFFVFILFFFAEAAWRIDSESLTYIEVGSSLNKRHSSKKSSADRRSTFHFCDEGEKMSNERSILDDEAEKNSSSSSLPWEKGEMNFMQVMSLFVPIGRPAGRTMTVKSWRTSKKAEVNFPGYQLKLTSVLSRFVLNQSRLREDESDPREAKKMKKRSVDYVRTFFLVGGEFESRQLTNDLRLRFFLSLYR